MAALDWSQCPAVESIPGKVSRAWVFKGTRLPVATVIENLEDLSVDEHQQNLRTRGIALVVLTGTTKWSLVRLHAQRIIAAVSAATPGSYVEVEIPIP
jgi:hypothetical protein